MEWMARTNPAPFASWKRYAEPPLQFDHRFEPVLAACTKASKTYSTRQHLTAPEIPEIVFFDSASWHRSWHRSWMVDVRCKDHEVRCRRCLATLIVQKGCDRSEEFRTVKEISWYPCDVHMSMWDTESISMSGGLRRSFLRDSPRRQSISTNLREQCEQCDAQVALRTQILAFWCFLILSDAFWCFLHLSAKIQVKTRQKCQMSYSVCKDLSRHSLCLSRNVTCHSCILCVWNLNYLLVRPPHIKFGVFCCSCHKSIFIGFNTGMVRLSKTRRLHSQGSLCWKGSACLVQAVRFLQRDEGR